VAIKIKLQGREDEEQEPRLYCDKAVISSLLGCEQKKHCLLSFLPLSVFLSLSLYIYHPLSVSLFLHYPLSISLSLYHLVSLSFSLPFSLYHSLSFSLSLSITLFLSLSPSPSLSPPSLSLSLSFYSSLSN
jgi:hypothetical protein